MRIAIEQQTQVQWVNIGDLEEYAEMQTRCDSDRLQFALTHLGNVEVVHAEYVSGGFHEVPRQPFDLPGFVQNDVERLEGLPDFCDVRVRVIGDLGETSIVTVWVPSKWNGRFLGVGGGSSRTEPMMWEAPTFARALTLPVALRNGFATAKTDGANRSASFNDWALDDDTGDLDWPLIQNLAHRSTHIMARVAKAVIEVLRGELPEYSYLAGCSGGGRQALAQAQTHPGDYDGIWAANPAIHWTKFAVAGMWPPLVMKELGGLSAQKLEVFRQAAIDANDGVDGHRDGVIGAFDSHSFDPKSLVGVNTSDGPITYENAIAMAMIWNGPRRGNGDFLWYGLRPGTESWSVMSTNVGIDLDQSNPAAAGVCATIRIDGVDRPLPFSVMHSYLSTWLLRDRNWDWTTLTFGQFEELFDRSVKELSILDSADPNLGKFDECGGKLLLTHGANDEVIPVDGTIEYYKDVVRVVGSIDQTREFARLFVTEGDGHGDLIHPGPGLSMAGGMSALMRWVEQGDVPDSIIAERMDPLSAELTATRPVYAYPYVPRYSGSGNPNDASSFLPELVNDVQPQN